MAPDPGSSVPTPPSDNPPPAQPARVNWFQRIGSILFIIFCLELGLFLMIYPWTDSWSGNYFSWIGPLRFQPVWHQIWNDGYVRGAISGLGLVNIWVAVAEALRKYIGNDSRQ